MASFNETTIARSQAIDTLIAAAEGVARTQDYGDMIGALRFVELAADQARRAVVAEARAAGTTWQEIGDALGVTRQAAEARFGGRATPSSAHRAYRSRRLDDLDLGEPTNFGGTNDRPPESGARATDSQGEAS